MKKTSVSIFVLLVIISMLSLGSCTHKHSLVHNEAKEATCRAEGNIEYWSCSGCEKKFSDAEAKNEITDVAVTASHSLVHNEAKEATCRAYRILELQRL